MTKGTPHQLLVFAATTELLADIGVPRRSRQIEVRADGQAEP